MTAPHRAELLKLLAQLAEHYPEWRFGQLVSNVAGWADVDVWDIEDEQMLNAIRSHLEHVKNGDQTIAK